MDNSEYVLVTEEISKFYKGQRVLNNVSMHIKKGDVYGFVGENGAGKTTIIRIISGLTYPESGSYKLFGVNSDDKEILEARKRTSAIVEAPSIYLNMSAYENLKMQMRMLGLPIDMARIDDLIKTVGLEGVSVKKKAVNFSLGMRQRLGIAMCLVSNPEFLILDEPLNGLDPEGIANMRNLILKLNQEKNITFLISSHILTELSLVATRYGIISRGELVKEISKEELEAVEKKETSIKTTNNERAYEILKAELSSEVLDYVNDTIIITGEVNITELVNKFMAESIAIVDIKTKQASIEDYYLSIIVGVRNA
jgi:ABC-2 type transport system ATP-binding protein